MSCVAGGKWPCYSSSRFTSSCHFPISVLCAPSFVGLSWLPKIKNHESWFFKKQSIIFAQPVTRRRGFNSRLQQQSFIFLQRSGGACSPSNLADEIWRVEPRWLDSVKKNPGQDPLLFLEILRSRFLGVWINLPLFPPSFLRVMIDYCEAAAAFPP